ncbi:hypothetical protein [Allorhodopirellula heiligendammensis]|uniref:Uncharacterized protein n=1 Tax=Allorhodopirellula heiligendammensis TaxID=2714739 RepID=A0A5C6BDB6_9BACT|nr:hypothetical protein [Allorhodopirellula heiligendammensis]TWU09960.1 hypothetical protein Poly21_52890 [Allorhodopirellula heiligendammensis]
MIRGEPKEDTLFDKANAAAIAAMQSVVDLASRTNTPVIVFRNGQIERIAPEAIVDYHVREESVSQSDTNAP